MTTVRPCRRLLLGVAVLLLASGISLSQGSAVEPSPMAPPAFNEKEFFAYKQKGQGTLAGQVFLGAASGKAITQAGAPVHLIPITPYTRHWFDHTVRTTACSAAGSPASAENPATPGPPTDCAHEALTRLQAEKRLGPYLRTTRANPTGHFWFTKIPAGRYYIVSLIEGGSGAHQQQDEASAGLAWLAIELDAGEKITNLVVTDCKTSLC